MDCSFPMAVFMTLMSSYVKLNTDGVVFSSRACASVGGIISDVNGVWQCGFTTTIRESTIFQVETRAMLEGLRLAYDKGFGELECDNTLLIEIILVGSVVDNRLTELRMIHSMLIFPWEVYVRQIPRTQNTMANPFTKNVDPELLQFYLLEGSPIIG
ncbi:hypothetical protein Golob_007901 [Gossypium lobatum]|uniref:RNase H type-1 domain-containing protein n=1 Tax=Gossypium lobatum TaxID=34289 RepID=A0A7J8ME66_9ROSI|nr:hypothetical protein [Gossypium lobatum]